MLTYPASYAASTGFHFYCDRIDCRHSLLEFPEALQPGRGGFQLGNLGRPGLGRRTKPVSTCFAAVPAHCGFGWLSPCMAAGPGGGRNLLRIKFGGTCFRTHSERLSSFVGLPCLSVLGGTHVRTVATAHHGCGVLSASAMGGPGQTPTRNPDICQMHQPARCVDHCSYIGSELRPFPTWPLAWFRSIGGYQHFYPLLVLPGVCFFWRFRVFAIAMCVFF